MQLEEAITTAIEFEKKVHESYSQAMSRARDPAARRFFEVLATEELGHVAYLESRLGEWQQTGHLTAAKLDTAIPSRARIAAGVERLRQRLGTPVASGVEVQLAQQAVEAEKEAAAFYAKMVGDLGAEGQELFTRFVEIEEGHLAIAQAEVNAATGLGFWFDVREFDLEAG
jgi:rubrerythrin